MNQGRAAVYRSAVSAGEVYHQLVREGIAPERIDVQPASAVRGLMPVVRSAMREGLVLGALLGSAAGAMVAFWALLIPDIAIRATSGESSLTAGAVAGGLVGAIAGAFLGLFRAEPQKRRYAELLMKSGVAVSVDSVDLPQLERVNEVFVRTRGVLLRAPAAPGDRRAPRQAYG